VGESSGSTVGERHAFKKRNIRSWRKIREKVFGMIKVNVFLLGKDEKQFNGAKEVRALKNYLGTRTWKIKKDMNKERGGAEF